MKKALSVFLLTCIVPLFTYAQIYDPIKWTFGSVQLAEDEYELQFKAQLEPNWHLYSQNLPSDDGPIATAFLFENLTGLRLVGKTQEPKPKVAYDPNFDMDLAWFSDEVVFRQKVKLTANKASISGELEYMVCDDKMCLPPDYLPFEFKLEKAPLKTPAKDDKSEIDSEITEDIAEESASTGILDPIKWHLRVGQNDTLELVAVIAENWHLYSVNLPEDDGPIPTEIEFIASDDASLIGDYVIDGEEITKYDPNFMMDLMFYEKQVVFKQKISGNKSNVAISAEVFFMACDDERCITPQGETLNIDFPIEALVKDMPKPKVKEEVHSNWAILIAGFLGGLLALLTPCVFPMIPLTVSFFTKRSKTKAEGMRNAIIYGLSIIGIYVLLGFGITVAFGPDALNALSTNFWFNIGFFLLFVVFAISFFGAFEITIPSSLINKVDAASDRGGLIGIFFMAFTLSLVSFSCTGPIIGTLLVEAAINGGVSGPLLGMFGFSLALALPFAVFAAFPGWLNSLPKSGGWLNSVKVVLGFLELALALKFLSNADLVVQGGFLKREVFIAIWIGVFAMMTIYLMGFITMPHDTKVERLSVTRMLFALVSLIATIYLIPGLWGAPLKIISGFPPPMFYAESPNGFGNAMVVSGAGGGHDETHTGNHCPHNLNCYHDFEEGLAQAKKSGKPVLLDFTGWACVNCRKMEEQVWADPAVLSILRNDVVLISLYVDEKTALPEDEQIEVQIGSKTRTLKTIGNKWSHFQASRYNTNSQPHYLILDHEENVLIEPAAYDPDIPKFVDWLKRGLKAFESTKQ